MALKPFNSVGGFSTGEFQTVVIDANANVFATAVATDSLLYANGQPWDFVSDPAGADTQIQFNDGGAFGADANLTFTKGTSTLATGNLTLTHSATVTGNVDAGNVTVTGNVSTGNILTDNILYANGQPWDFVSDPAGSNTEIQFNDGGVFGASANLAFNKNTNTLSVDALSAIDANLSGSFTAAGTANITGTLTAGNLNTTGNANIANLEVTSTANVGNLYVSGTSNLVGNVEMMGNLAVNWGISAASGNITGNLSVGNLNAGNITGNVAAPGSDTQVIFNNNGVLGADAGMEYNVGSETLTVTHFGGTSINLSGNANIGGYLDVTSNVTAGNVIASGQIMASGNIGGGNVIANGVYVNGPVQANSLDIINGGSANIAGNMAVTGSISSSANISATGQLSAGGNLQIGENANVVGNLVAGNIQTTGSLGAGAVYAENVTASGNVNAGVNIHANGNISSNGFANFGSNVTVGNGLVVTSGDANVQSGNLSASGNLVIGGTANVTGNAVFSENLTVAGNLSVEGNLIYVNVEDLNVEDPLISLGTGPNGAPLTSNDGKDRGVLLDYFTTAPVSAYMGWKNSAGEFEFASNVSVANNVVTVNEYANVVAANFIGNVIGNISGNIVAPGSNTQILFNDGGDIGANANLTYDKATDTLSAGTLGATGNLTVGADATVTGNLSVTTDVAVTGNLQATGYLATSGNLSVAGEAYVMGNIDLSTNNSNIVGAGNVEANIVAANTVAIIGTGITAANLATTDTSSHVLFTGEQHISYEFLVKAVDQGSNATVLSKVLAVPEGDYMVYGQCVTGTMPGTIDVTSASFQVQLNVTSASANNTIWVVQARAV